MKLQVYKICNSETDDTYVGCTGQSLKRRMGKHKSEAKIAISNSKLHLLMGLVGSPLFHIEMLEQFDSNDFHRGEREQFWINLLKPSLNTIPAHSESRRSRKPTDYIKHVCECGGKYLQMDRCQHNRTRKHQDFLARNKPIENHFEIKLITNFYAASGNTINNEVQPETN